MYFKNFYVAVRRGASETKVIYLSNVWEIQQVTSR